MEKRRVSLLYTVIVQARPRCGPSSREMKRTKEKVLLSDIQNEKEGKKNYDRLSWAPQFLFQRNDILGHSCFVRFDVLTDKQNRKDANVLRSGQRRTTHSKGTHRYDTISQFNSTERQSDRVRPPAPGKQKTRRTHENLIQYPGPTRQGPFSLFSLLPLYDRRKNVVSHNRTFSLPALRKARFVRSVMR